MLIIRGAYRHAIGKISLLLIICLPLLLTSRVEATVTFQGTTNPSTAPSSSVIPGVLQIGFGVSPASEDPRAFVSISQGSFFEAGQSYIGSDDGYYGRLSIEGPETSFIIDENGTLSEPAFQIGRDGEGFLSLTDGAYLGVQNISGDMSIGDNETGYGTVIVSDDRTMMSIGQNLTIGNEGIGYLEILNGAFVRTLDDTVADVTIGAKSSGYGTVLVDGRFTRFLIGDDLTIGDDGVGRLTISDQAVVDANSRGNQTKVGKNGRLILDNGTLLFDTLTIDGILEGHGILRGDGSGSGNISIRDSGRITANYGQHLQFLDDANNQGTIDVKGGEIEFFDTFTNKAIGTEDAPGRISLDSGRIRFSKGLANYGVIAVTAGVADLHGQVSNETGGSIIVARNAVATFHDDFTDNSGVLNILAGGNALFLADVGMQTASVLALTLEQDLDAPLGEGAPLSAAGNFNLAGNLSVSVGEGFTVTEGEIYKLLSANTLTGILDTAHIADIPGVLEFELIKSPTSLLLLVQDESELTLAGDFDFDGVVDDTDFLVWRDGFGTIYTQDDYFDWARHYGFELMTPQTVITALAVPEPPMQLLALTMLALLFSCGLFYRSPTIG